MEKLNELISLCKCGVHVTINEHRDCYQTVEQHFEEPYTEDYKDDIDTEVFGEMCKANTLVSVQFYQHTPIGFYRVDHFDIEKAIDKALQIARREVR